MFLCCYAAHIILQKSDKICIASGDAMWHVLVLRGGEQQIRQIEFIRYWIFDAFASLATR